MSEQIYKKDGYPIATRLRLLSKRVLFPGLNIGTRRRMKFCQYFLSGNIVTLDAGCGNGAFAYQAYRLGNKVLGINIDAEQVKRCEEYRDYIGIDPFRCQFKVHNIYDLLSLKQEFDQIICFETLEHLKKDEEVLAVFRRAMRPGGLLHICTPRADRRPYWGETISEEENGSHVRLGYTFEKFEEMLGQHGFVITNRDSAIGFFSLKIEEVLNWMEMVVLQHSKKRVSELVHAVIFLCLYPFTFLDWFVTSQPLSIYVQARRVG